jgi:hypothetical protein
MKLLKMLSKPARVGKWMVKAQSFASVPLSDIG